MSLNVSISIDDKDVRRAFKVAPSAMIRHIERQQERGAHELAREEKSVAPKAFSTLTNSIHVRREGRMHFSVAPGVRYAPHVEGGSGPGGSPGMGAMLRWIRVKGISSERYPDERDLARAIMFGIRTRGIRKQPFVEPSVERKQSRLIALMEKGVEDGLREAFA